jgi:hypothetical protein
MHSVQNTRRGAESRNPVTLSAIQHCQKPLEWIFLFVATFRLSLESTNPIQSELLFLPPREMRQKCECDHSAPTNERSSFFLPIIAPLSSTLIRTLGETEDSVEEVGEEYDSDRGQFFLASCGKGTIPIIPVTRSSYMTQLLGSTQWLFLT